MRSSQTEQEVPSLAHLTGNGTYRATTEMLFSSVTKRIPSIIKAKTTYWALLLYDIMMIMKVNKEGAYNFLKVLEPLFDK